MLHVKLQALKWANIISQQVSDVLFTNINCLEGSKNLPRKFFVKPNTLPRLFYVQTILSEALHYSNAAIHFSDQCWNFANFRTGKNKYLSRYFNEGNF